MGGGERKDTDFSSWNCPLAAPVCWQPTESSIRILGLSGETPASCLSGSKEKWQEPTAELTANTEYVVLEIRSGMENSVHSSVSLLGLARKERQGLPQSRMASWPMAVRDRSPFTVSHPTDLPDAKSQPLSCRGGHAPGPDPQPSVKGTQPHLVWSVQSFEKVENLAKL